VAVGDEGGGVVVRGGGAGVRRGEERREGEEVAAAGWAGGDEGEDLGDEALLDCCVLYTAGLVVGGEERVGGGTNELGVELGQPRLTVVVEDQYGVDHRCSMSGKEAILGCGLEFGHVKP